ncbi:hypothetical protein PG990_000586 [Apiospora arundinis]
MPFNMNWQQERTSTNDDGNGINRLFGKRWGAGSDEGIGNESLTPDKTRDEYVAELKEWRDDNMVRPGDKVRNRLPSNWYLRPVLDIIDACPAFLDLWIEAVASGDELFCPTRWCPSGYFLPHDLLGMTFWGLTDEHPRFEDLLVSGIFRGRLVVDDPDDREWLESYLQNLENAEQRVRAWLNNLPHPLQMDDPFLPLPWKAPHLPVKPDASTSTQKHGNTNGGEGTEANVIPDNFKNLSLPQCLAIIPAAHEALEQAGLDGFAYVPRQARRDAVRLGDRMKSFRMGQILEYIPELRDALTDLLLASKIRFASLPLHIVIQSVRMWYAEGTCSLSEAREKVSRCWDRLNPAGPWQ